MPKCECGFSYVSGYDEDEIQHRIRHDAYLHGPALDYILDLPSLCSVAGYPFLVIDSSIPEETRFRLSKTVLVAQRTTPDYPAGYDGIISESDEKLFLVKDNNRAIGMVITAKEEAYWQLSWTEKGTVQLLDRKQYVKSRQKIARVWVVKAYRHKGIGPLMLKATAEYLGYKISDIGWELPLTKDGAVLVQKLVPSKWWGRGDLLALQETLDASGYV